MKKLVIILVSTIFWSCGDDFLDNPPNIGLTPDKLREFVNSKVDIDEITAKINHGANLKEIQTMAFMKIQEFAKAQNIPVGQVKKYVKSGVKFEEIQDVMERGLTADKLVTIVNSGISLEQIEKLISNSANVEDFEEFATETLEKFTLKYNIPIDQMNEYVHKSDVSVQNVQDLLTNGVTPNQIEDMVKSAAGDPAQIQAVLLKKVTGFEMEQLKSINDKEQQLSKILNKKFKFESAVDVHNFFFQNKIDFTDIDGFMKTWTSGGDDP